MINPLLAVNQSVRVKDVSQPGALFIFNEECASLTAIKKQIGVEEQSGHLLEMSPHEVEINGRLWRPKEKCLVFLPPLCHQAAPQRV